MKKYQNERIAFNTEDNLSDIEKYMDLKQLKLNDDRQDKIILNVRKDDDS